MRILPTTRRGTWLLAGAVWVAACAGLWWALPVGPRDVLLLPDGSDLVGFGPGGDTVLVRSRISSSSNLALFALDVLSPSVESVKRLLVPCETLEPAGNSADCRTWLIRSGSTRFVAIDVTKPSIQSLAISKNDAKQYVPYGLSPNGRFALFRDDAHGFAVVLWDILANRRHAILPELTLPELDSIARLGMAFSGDSLSLVALVKDQQSVLRVIDVETLRSRATFARPDSTLDLRVGTVRLNHDGTLVAADYYPRGSATGLEFRCWDVNTQNALVRSTNLLNPQFLAEAQLFAVWAFPRGFEVYDLTNSAPRFRLPQSGFHYELSADGRTIAEVTTEIPFSPLGWLSQKVGLSTPSRVEQTRLRFFDATRGDALGTAVVRATDQSRSFVPGLLNWIPGQRSVALRDPDDHQAFYLWDIPPRMTVMQSAFCAALLALPIACLARRRVRKLRSVAA